MCYASVKKRVKDIVTHPVSTGFSRTISAAEICLGTGLVSLIGWGEAGLELGAWHWGPGKNREEDGRKG